MLSNSRFVLGQSYRVKAIEVNEKCALVRSADGSVTAIFADSISSKHQVQDVRDFVEVDKFYDAIAVATNPYSNTANQLSLKHLNLEPLRKTAPSDAVTVPDVCKANDDDKVRLPFPDSSSSHTRDLTTPVDEFRYMVTCDSASELTGLMTAKQLYLNICETYWDLENLSVHDLNMKALKRKVTRMESFATKATTQRSSYGERPTAVRFFVVPDIGGKATDNNICAVTKIFSYRKTFIFTNNLELAKYLRSSKNAACMDLSDGSDV